MASIGSTTSAAMPLDMRAGWPPRWRLALALAACWLVATAWLRPLAIPDEGRYVGVAREMLLGGDWLVPRLDGLPFLHKPPLFYWITAGAMQLFGPTVWAARLASWLGALLGAGALLLFLRRWAGEREALVTLVVLVTLPLFYGGAQYANMDMLVAGCIGATVLAGAHAMLLRAEGRVDRRVLVTAWLCAALGVLAKGLIGVLLPLLVLVLWAASTRRLRAFAALLAWLPGWLLFAAVAAPWFVAMQWRFPAFGHYFFVVQHLQRFASGGFNNVQPFWFYGAVLAAATLPWSPWLRRLARTEVGARRDLRRLMLIWLGVVTLFFSLPQSKLVGYILPTMMPLAALIGEGVQHGRTRLQCASAALAAGLCVVLALVAHGHQPKSLQPLAEHLRAWRRPGEAVVFVGQYYYDVGFYAALAQPAWVVDPWRPADVARDSWRRELADGAQFDAAAAAPLLRPDELDAALCRVPGAWVVASLPLPPGLEALAAHAPASQLGSTALWHLAPAPGCWRRAMPLP